MDSSLKSDEIELNPTLKEGDTGNYVIILQAKLKVLGYYDLSITGSFDNYTKDAVVKFQKANEINPTGIVNYESWLKLYELTSQRENAYNIKQTKPTLKLGSTGIYVVELQTLLKDLLYYNGPIDGNFDTTTQTAVKSFQTNNRLTADGIVGRNTWSALETLYTPLAICNGENQTYTVVSGDTLWKIAQKFNTTVDEIKNLNNLTNNIITIGQKLLIPSSDNNIIPPSNNITYTVVKGDTLWKLSQRFNTTVDAIKKLNDLMNNNLSIGQKLLIPTNNQNITNYVVVRGDTLWSLARKFNTTVSEIKKLNNLTSDNLSIGQKLLISQNY